MEKPEKMMSVADLLAGRSASEMRNDARIEEVEIPEMSDRAKAAFDSLGILGLIEGIRRELWCANTKGQVDLLIAKLTAAKTMVATLKLADETNDKIGEITDSSDIDGVDIHLIRKEDGKA